MAAKTERKIHPFKSIISLILALVMLVTGISIKPANTLAETVPGEVSSQEGISPDYKKAAESDTYELYLYEPTLSVILKNKSTGAFIRSTLSPEEDDGKNNKTWNAYMQSGLVISAIKGTTDTYQVDLVSCKNTIDYSYAEKGFSAKIYFDEYQFGLTVNVSLDGDDLIVEVPDESILEDNAGSYIGTVSLFPFMGYTYLDSQGGYMFIPDGNGALIHLDDKHKKYTTGFSQMIYGSDIGFDDSSTEAFLWGMFKMVNSSQKVIAPVFGMVHSDNQQAYLAIVEEGDKRASIEAHPNGVMVDYNRCFAKFVLRRIYVQPLNNSNSGTVTNVEGDRSHSDLKIRYHLLDQDNANYSGMAVAYRNYLLEQGLITVKDTTYRTRVDFLGSDREKFLVFTKAVPMTTTAQIREIYDELKKAGVESLITIYKGWQKGGMFNLPITKFKADKAIGGTSNLTDLIKDSAELDYQMYLFNDALRANTKTSNTTFNVVKRVNKRRLELNTYQSVYQYFNYLLPSKTDSVLKNFIKSYTKKGVNNLALTEITNNLYSYSYGGSFYSRFDCGDTYENTMKELAENTNMVMETPFAYLWDYTQAIMEMPLGSSNYMYVDEEVPFFSMVLKGIVPMYSNYVNFEANKNKFFLQMAEAGVSPSFYLTYADSADLIYTNSSNLYSTLYDTYKETVVEYDEWFRNMAEATAGAFIVNHEKLENDVNVVTYNNGTKIYVNYSEEDASINGETINGMSAKVVK